jgi:glycosyltransferase involved in cell wall biosynthesis
MSLSGLEKSDITAQERVSEKHQTFPVCTTTKSIKVMHVISDLSIGGAEMALYKLLAKTNRQRFEPIVVSLCDHGVLRERIEALGVAVHTAGMKPGRPSLAGLWRLVSLIRQLQPDLVFGWMYHSCLAIEVAKIFSGRRMPVLWGIHCSSSPLLVEKKLTTAVIRFCGLLSRRPAKIVFVSHAGQSEHQRLRYHVENSCVIPNGIDTKKFIPSTQARSSVRSEMGLTEDAFLIGIIGRSHPMKDHANFLAAAGLISKTHPETHFLLIGRGMNQGNQALVESIRKLGIGDRAHLLGEHHDTSRLAAALDIFTLSSAYGESCPNVIGEAMASGVPCVVTNVGDADWLVGETGRVVPPREANALASACRELIDLKPQDRAALGLLARERVLAHFPIQSIIGRYEELYETILMSHAPERSRAMNPSRIGALSPTFDETGTQ